MTQTTKPHGSPPCWGLQYEDHDPDCAQCPYKDSCRPEVFRRFAATPIKPPQSPISLTPPRSLFPSPPQTHLPVFRPPAPPWANPSAPATQFPVPVAAPQWMAPAPQPVAPIVSFQDPRYPNPAAQMSRPGASGPPYYFTQYPGETTAQRLGKNVLLRGLEAIFGELMYFFKHWTWPPR